ncbi:hypothetical protein ACOMHN_034565 [Nucella lapillus]
MTITTFLGLVRWSKLTGTGDDDAVDRLNHLYTVVLLMVCAVLGTGTMLFGEPIACWTPANFPGTYIKYVRSYCYVRNTYYIPMDQAIPVEYEKRESEELTYYQWVPFIMLFMAFLFKFPCYVWSLFSEASGIDLGKVCDDTESLVAQADSTRTQGVDRLAIHIDRWLKAHRFHQTSSFNRFRQHVSSLLCVFGMKREPSYLSLLYLFMKMLYTVNVVCQFFLLTAFLGEWHLTYGADVLKGFFSHEGWKESPRFPRVTLCDFDIRQLQNIQRYTVQCTLNVNVYLDKVFFFLWFWLIFVALVTTCSFVFWLWRVFSRQNHKDYVKKYLVIQDKLKTKEDRKLIKQFVQDYLHDDGVFLLRMMARNSHIILMSEILGQLFENFKKKSAEKKK